MEIGKDFQITKTKISYTVEESKQMAEFYNWFTEMYNQYHSIIDTQPASTFEGEELYEKAYDVLRKLFFHITYNIERQASRLLSNLE